MAAVLLGAMLGPTLPAAGQAPAEEAESTSVAVPCLNHPTIRRTKILGDRNIVFVTRDGSIYNNALPRQCPSLGPRSMVNYPIANSELCAGNSFTVLWRAGMSYQPAFVCRLGMFAPISEDELADLETMTAAERKQSRGRRRNAPDMVTAEPVELPEEPASQSSEGSP